MARRIGIDLDNTIIAYDEAFRSAAQSRSYVDRNFVGGKQEIRDRLRQMPEGELAWQRLQGYVYGQGIGNAAMFPGVESFLRRCRKVGHKVMIVSHKTEYGHHDPKRVNLREAARAWMAERAFFAPDGFGLSPGDIYFEATRADKLARIKTLECTDFIDDLEEVLGDPGFPSGVSRLLFCGAGNAPADAPYRAFSDWAAIERYVFDAAI